MADWFNNLQDLAGEHPEAERAHTPPLPRSERAGGYRTAARVGAGSLDLPGLQMSVIECAAGEALVEAPVRLPEGSNASTTGKRKHIRMPEELDRFIYANSRGSVNATVAALISFALGELQRTNRKLVVTAAGSEIVDESANPGALET